MSSHLQRSHQNTTARISAGSFTRHPKALSKYRALSTANLSAKRVNWVKPSPLSSSRSISLQGRDTPWKTRMENSWASKRMERSIIRPKTLRISRYTACRITTRVSYWSMDGENGRKGAGVSFFFSTLKVSPLPKENPVYTVIQIN